MDDKIQIDTQTVSDIADKLALYNKEIDNSFEPVKNSINDLSYNWSGSASEQAIAKFNSIKNQYIENSETSRHRVIDNYVKILKQKVGIGYETTENRNKKLADAFK